MLCVSLFNGRLVSHAGARRHYRRNSRLSAASALALVVAAAPCELPMITNGAVSTTLSCSPPRIHTRNANLTRRLTIPETCLAAAKTRRRRQPGGSGGDEEVPSGDDGGSYFGGGDGDDDDFSSWWWGGEDGDEGRGRQPSGFSQDLVLLWTVFSGLCFLQTLQHVARQTAKQLWAAGAGPEPHPHTGMLAAVSAGHLGAQGSCTCATCP